MKNDNELFIGGDPRFLAGAAFHARASDYAHRPCTISRTARNAVATTRSLSADAVLARGVQTALSDKGVKTHRGKASYHHRPDLNVFLREGEWPSAGVELETEERADVGYADLEGALCSNWFHFESDSSLATCGRSGYELITEPLPPRFYRNPRLWAGLQNILAPWVESWGFSETGLHVHVGLTQFEDETGGLGFLHTSSDRRVFAKQLIAYLYFKVAERTFIDRVFLRKPSGYCSAPQSFICGLPDREDGLTGGRLVSQLLAAMMADRMRDGGAYAYYCDRLRVLVARDLPDSGVDLPGLTPLLSTDGAISGHHVELNMGNSQTIEFRRGKGTLNCVSILRMVECATLLVRFAAKLLRSPDTVVGPAELYRYMIDNTTSGALKTLAERQLRGE